MRNLLLFGCDFFTSRKTSELNFWLDMVEHFARHFPKVVVLSVNNRPVPRERMSTNIVVYNVRPHYVGNRPSCTDPEYTGKAFHRLPLGPGYKTYTLIRNLRVIDELIERYQIGVMHYMRVFGVLNELLTRRHRDIVFSMTVPTHIDRGFPLHVFYHALKRLGLRAMDTLVTTTAATQGRLMRLGIPPGKIEVIPWSSKRAERTRSAADAARARARLGLSPDRPLVLWSGPLQHTGEAEFRSALRVAKGVAGRSDRYQFVFAFKPDAMREEFARTADGIAGMTVRETDRETFDELQRAATVFLSPLCNPNRTVAPPLTWVEMMGLGVPLVTTQVPGVEELVDHERTGFVVHDSGEAVDVLCKVSTEAWQTLGAEGARVVHERFNLKDIASAYVSMWNDRLKNKKP